MFYIQYIIREKLIWQLLAILTITIATLFTDHRRMRTVFHHRGVWTKIWNIRGHLGCHTAICKIITLDAPYIGTITRNVTRATSLTLERRSCVNKYEISSSSRIWKHLTFKIFEQQEESPGRPNICLAHEEGWYTPEMAICRGMCHPKG